MNDVQIGVPVRFLRFVRFVQCGIDDLGFLRFIILQPFVFGGCIFESLLQYLKLILVFRQMSVRVFHIGGSKIFKAPSIVQGLSVGLPVELQKNPAKGRLSTAAFTDQAEGFSPKDVDIDSIDGPNDKPRFFSGKCCFNPRILNRTFLFSTSCPLFRIEAANGVLLSYTDQLRVFRLALLCRVLAPRGEETAFGKVEGCGTLPVIVSNFDWLAVSRRGTESINPSV